MTRHLTSSALSDLATSAAWLLVINELTGYGVTEHGSRLEIYIRWQVAFVYPISTFLGILAVRRSRSTLLVSPRQQYMYC
ncbi:hypothetical protein BDW66DRAFT_112394 [Aspergillus desertorum]